MKNADQMVIQIGNDTYKVELYENRSADELKQALPLTISMSRWGDEYYGQLPVEISAVGTRRADYEIGEVALWPDGNSFCIFFGPTPASVDGKPRMASPGIPLGIIREDSENMRGYPASLRQVKLSLVK